MELSAIALIFGHSFGTDLHTGVGIDGWMCLSLVTHSALGSLLELCFV